VVDVEVVVDYLRQYFKHLSKGLWKPWKPSTDTGAEIWSRNFLDNKAWGPTLKLSASKGK